MGKKILCPYCGGIMELISEPFPDDENPTHHDYYECFDCGMMIGITSIYNEEILDEQY